MKGDPVDVLLAASMFVVMLAALVYIGVQLW